MVLALAAAVLGPWLVPADPRSQELALRLAGPTLAIRSGSTNSGATSSPRLVAGARISLIVGVSVVSVSALVGFVVGRIAGYAGGWADTLIGRVIDVLMAFPGILLAIALVAALGPSLRNVVIALATIGWVGYARLVRGQVLKAREFEYVQAARLWAPIRRACCHGTCCRSPIPPCSCRPRSGWRAPSSPRRP